MNIDNKDVIYANISAENEPYVIDSFCVGCEAQGKTTILLTKIPMFQDIILVSFCCDHCGYRNNEVQFGGQLKELGVTLSLTVSNLEDLSRQVIRSEHCKISLPDIDFEMPCTKKSNISTLEGFLANIIEDLSGEQPIRKIMHPDLYQQLEQVIAKLQDYRDGKNLPFKWLMQDPSGNSFIQNPHYPQHDKNLKIQHYSRAKEELEAMGYSVENQIEGQQQQVKQQEEKAQMTQDEVEKSQIIGSGHEEVQAGGQDMNKGIEDQVKGESLSFPTPCNVCSAMGENKMCTISIPFFREVIIMAFSCAKCGFKDSEVKSGGAMSERGRIITLKVQSPIDIKRDVFKSETASLEIPELELELQYGTLGGVYSTVEGLLEKIATNLGENNPFVGDSQENFREKAQKFFGKLEEYRTGEVPFTLIIKDLVDNSFIANPYHPNEDQNILREEFDRTEEDNEFLGLDHMKTENYQ